MQKKIIVLAIAGALTAPAMALADTANINFYGQANVSYDLVRTGDGVPANPATTGVSSNRVTSNDSRIGLKGSEDLGGGLSAVFQMEGAVGMDTGTSTLFSRNTYAGLKSESMGEVVMGKHDTPYKMSTRRLDVFADGIADNRALMGGVGMSSVDLGGLIGGTLTTITSQASSAMAFDGRASDFLGYSSPTISGFTGMIGYVNGNEARARNSQAKTSGTSLAGTYDMAPFYAAVAYETHSITPPPAASALSMSEHATKIGGSYAVDAFAVNLVYEKTSDDFNAGTNALGHNAIYLAGKYNISSSDTVKAAYTKAGKLGTPAAVDSGAKQYSLGYDHAMSKHTTIYALYTKLKNDPNVGYGFYGGGAYNTSAGASPSALSFGMKHSF